LIKKKFLIGGLIILIALAFLLYQGFSSSTIYYYTVSEFLARENNQSDKYVRVSGDVASASIEKDSQNLLTRFNIADSSNTLAVEYRGVTPDAFKSGATVVIEGKLDTDGIFKANTILTKCPSKYTPKIEGNSQ
jgi:cytochrome c-type biogenesis protein CcmE